MFVRDEQFLTTKPIVNGYTFMYWSTSSLINKNRIKTWTKSKNYGYYPVIKAFLAHSIVSCASLFIDIVMGSYEFLNLTIEIYKPILKYG